MKDAQARQTLGSRRPPSEINTGLTPLIKRDNHGLHSRQRNTRRSITPSNHDSTMPKRASSVIPASSWSI